MASEPTVILVFNENHELCVMLPEGVRVLSIDEAAPHDRVYRFTANSTPDELDAMVAGAEIGSRHDERHAACVARIEAAQTGKPILAIVEDDGQQG
jgi:hypothetical protein